MALVSRILKADTGPGGARAALFSSIRRVKPQKCNSYAASELLHLLAPLPRGTWSFIFPLGTTPAGAASSRVGSLLGVKCAIPSRGLEGCIYIFRDFFFFSNLLRYEGKIMALDDLINITSR